MTNNLRDEIARREKICEAATPGRPQVEWAKAGGRDECKHGYYKVFECPHCVESFVAHARTGYPETLAALADAVAALEACKAAGAVIHGAMIPGTGGDTVDDAIDSIHNVTRAALAQIAGRLGGTK